MFALPVLQVVTNGASHGLLASGDILVEVNGKLVTTFIELESAVDDALTGECGSLAGEVTLLIDRGGQAVTVTPKVSSCRRWLCIGQPCADYAEEYSTPRQHVQ